jgi:hypothetical protein
LTSVHLHDHNRGMKCYRREVFREVRLYGELHRFVPVLAHARGFRVGELVIQHRPRKHGHSKYGMQRFYKGFLDLLTVKFLTGFGQRPQHALGTFGLASFALGALGMIYFAIYWIVAQWAPEMFEGNSGLKIPRSLFTAFNAWLRGDRDRARSAAAAAQPDFERQMAGRKDADQFAFFGALFAALQGDAPAARRWLEADERYARSINDAVLVKGTSNSRMLVMMLLGERAAVLDLLEQALADPVGGGEVADAAQVAIDPLWKELRDDPRFKAVIAKHRPKD